MMTVVEQLDQTLFENFLNPKVAIATGKLRSGILDPEMDWYETPQPTGTVERLSGFFFFFFFF
jgi:exocyst complex component 2